MDTEKPPSSPEADIGVQQIPAAESVPAHQPPGEESKDAAKRAASPTAEHNKTADQQPVFEATTTKSEEQGPQLPAAIASVRPRIYERYEQDAEKFSTALWAIPRAPSPVPVPRPKRGHTHVTIDIHPTQALQVALDSQRRLPPLYPVKPTLWQRVRKSLRERKCFIISATLMFLGVMVFVCLIVAMLWLNKPGPKGKVAYDLYDKEWWYIW